MLTLEDHEAGRLYDPNAEMNDSARSFLKMVIKVADAKWYKRDEIEAFLYGNLEGQGLEIVGKSNVIEAIANWVELLGNLLNRIRGME